jgi:hypothetical protein
MTECPFLIVVGTADSRSLVAGALARADAEFIAEARTQWPLDARALEDARHAAAAADEDRQRLERQLTAAQDRLAQTVPSWRSGTPGERTLLLVLLRVLGAHARGHDWAIRWADVQRVIEAAGIADWQDLKWGWATVDDVQP